MTKRVIALSCATALAAAGWASAAPTYLQDYEAPGDLDAPFNLHAGYSGTSQGETASVAPTIVADGAEGTAQSATWSFADDPAQTAPTSGGWDWQIRLLPNGGGSTNTSNPLFAADGYVGFYLKVPSTVTADVQVAPVLEGPAGTGEGTVGTLQNVIKDGEWHLYQWNMDDPAAFNTPWKDVYDDAAALGDSDLEDTNSFDSIAFVSTNGGDMTFQMDQLQYDSAGPIPEPASLGLLSLAIPALMRRRRGA